jgi:hypothetical protein
MEKNMNYFATLCFVPLLSTLTFLSYGSQYPKKMVINVPVANLNFKPETIDSAITLPTNDITNPLLITQMLMNEYLFATSEYIDEHGTKWLHINAIQQEKFITPSGWHGYPGWIPAQEATEVKEFPACNIVIKNLVAHLEDYNEKRISTFSMGSRFKAVKVDKECWRITLADNRTAYFNDEDVYLIKSKVRETIQELRNSIVATAKKFLNFPYSWGGRTAHNSIFGNISSVDCSGMINVSFLAHGLQIPRMSKDQFLHALEIKNGAELQQGDLIFFASINKNGILPSLNKQLQCASCLSKHPLHIDHVMMYIGNDQMIESSWSDDHMVRIIDGKKRMGKPCNQIVSGDIISVHNEQYYVYFSTFFTPEMIQQLRDDALKTDYDF